ncbi:MAG TPA: sulfatase-like hydrolase/transferase [Chthoniobacteraceae bacterium]|nr:sulfatase-like hydrolase/transferase [Chthoniobacteraceae bacterium]
MTPPRPNIILILADDMGSWAAGCCGNREIITPNLDRLATEGVRFENAFCTSPVCSPARASILTGRMPSRHGVHDWICGNGAVRYLEGESTFVDDLAGAGYACGLVGKWHLGDSARPQCGFRHWEATPGGEAIYRDTPMVRDGQWSVREGYATERITDGALGLLRQLGGGNAPFFLSVNYTAPHAPWGRAHHPAHWFDPYFRDCPFESVPNLPPHPWQRLTAPRPRNGSERRELLAGYFGAVSAMDAGIGRILRLLRELGLEEQTTLLFTSDNGMNMGHHGIYGKGNGTSPLNLYDTSVKVPLIIKSPRVLHAGSVSHEMISHYDLRPTLLSLARLPVENFPSPGRDRSQLLAGDPGGGAEVSVVYDEYGDARMIRTRQWKYIDRTISAPPELYHLADDPDETRNRFSDPACREIQRELKQQLALWFQRHTLPERDGRKFPVKGDGQAGRCDGHTPPIFF